MLGRLSIHNFALIEHLELELHPGLNILTGETGAGKSIVLDALDAALGGKVSAKAIRTGSTRAEIAASFSMATRLEQWLVAAEIEPEPELVCSREITARSNRQRINGTLVNRQQVLELRQLLLEITAQGQAVSLGESAQQRDWLDIWGGHQAVRLELARQYDQWSQTRTQLEQVQSRDRLVAQHLEMIQFQLEELTAAALDQPNEMEQINQEITRLSHSVELEQQSYHLYSLLYQSDRGHACADLLGKAEQVLTELVQLDPGLENVLELVTSALVQVEEAGREINSYASSLESDPETLANLEQRLRLLKQIERKYGPTLKEAIARQQQLATELDQYHQQDQTLDQLSQLLAKQEQQLHHTCTQLSQLRQGAAQLLQQQLVTALKSLAMEKVRFEVKLTAIAPTASGSDQVSFWFSANPGEPLQPLAETASGGEISRFLLALKTCLAQNTDLSQTLVFDEVDVGVSGRVAQAIASQLYQLSRHSQVLCVTHQPIIAAIADHHFQVSKQVSQERTQVQITYLQPKQRLQELAQLAAGSQAKNSLAFAKTLMQQANSLKQSLPLD
ncbi:MAG: DNA repair protein RecN [Pseudanabaenaceae cyanobacterium bins.68]|nr:DNA repair protein RecN [Pseudanabaenaceae cyanobacterium bins.68]